MNALRSAILRGARRGALPHGAGVRSGRPGDGYEFAQLRQYEPGDDPRRIDWAATARIGALQTRVYLDDTVLVLAALVDESPSMTAGRKRPLATAAHEAVRAWFASAETGDRTQRLVDERVITDRRAAVQVAARTPFRLRVSLTLAARVLPRGASLLVITDGLDLAPDDDDLGLLGARIDATVLLARDPWLEGLPLRGFVRIRDLESGAVRRVFFGRRERERYVRATAERDAAIRRRFEGAGWRVGTLDEADGRGSLERAFGLR